jgi:hypothetical protein
VAIDRLSGGLTPKDGADPRTFPTIWNETADEIERIDGDVTAVEGRVTTAEGDIVAVEGRVTSAEGDIGQLQTDVLANTSAISDNDGDISGLDSRLTSVEDELDTGFRLVGTRYFTASGTFAKADPFGDGSFDGALMRAVRVTVVGGGGGSGGTNNNDRTSAGGGAGGYGIKLVTDIAGLSSSETITVGAAGAGGAAGDFAGTAGGTTTALGATANGGAGGTSSSAAFLIPEGGTATGVDFAITGDSGSPRSTSRSNVLAGSAGTPLSGRRALIVTAFNARGSTGLIYGGGGQHSQQVDTATAGSSGAAGIVILEVFA